MPDPIATLAGIVTPRDFIWLGCQSGNHEWEFIGGVNAGCSPDCQCSAPIHQCAKCGDYDYGDNDEADQVRKDCAIGGIGGSRG